MANPPTYLVSALRDGDRWGFRVRDLPGGLGWADSEAGVLDAAREVISVLLDVLPGSFEVMRIHHSRWSEIKRVKGAA